MPRHGKAKRRGAAALESARAPVPPLAPASPPTSPRSLVRPDPLVYPVVMLRFVHITDTHVGPTPHYTLYGRQPLAWLQRMVQQIGQLPCPIDFILHAGDVTDEGSAESYALAREALEPLTRRWPVHFVVGNHDDCLRLQTTLTNATTPLPRLDYAVDLGSHRMLVIDTRGPVDPGGRFTPEQADWIQDQASRDARPLLVAMHHAPVPLDTAWLDEPPPAWGGRFMYLEGAGLFRDAIAPFRARIAGVFFGHVHGGFSVNRGGVLFVAGRSGFGPLVTMPGDHNVLPDDPEPPGFNIVTVTSEQTLVRTRAVRLVV